MTKYSFLTPVYKTEFLREAIDSMLLQSYRDFDIIISDDCSPNDIAGELSTYNDQRIRYRKNKVNIGGERLVEHWNLLLKECNSEYVIMASDDDIYSPDFLEIVDSLTLKYPEVDVIRTRVQRINENSEVTAKEDIFDEYQSKIEALNSIFCGNYIGCVGNYVFKRSILLEKGGFLNLPYAWFSDMVAAISLMDKGQVNTKELLFNFRLSDYNISGMKRNKRIDQSKLLATLHFDNWICTDLNRITPHTLLEKKEFEQVIREVKHRVYSQSGDYSWALPLWKWFNIYKSLEQNLFFSKNSFCKYFAIAVINRLLG